MASQAEKDSLNSCAVLKAQSGVRSGRVILDKTSWFCFQPLTLLTCWRKDRAGNCEGVLCLSQKAAFGSDPQRMRTSSTWDPVDIISPASCSQDVD